MNKIMFMGPVQSGKTTLIQAMNGEKIRYVKTQAIEFDGMAIDTPGEYIENRQYLYALTVTAADADIIIFTQDPTADSVWYSPGQSSMFNAKVIGVITKCDIAEKEKIEHSEQVLKLAGVEKIFKVSSVTRQGIDALMEYIAD